jgi:hypothetical protein
LRRRKTSQPERHPPRPLSPTRTLRVAPRKRQCHVERTCYLSLLRSRGCGLAAGGLGVGSPRRGGKGIEAVAGVIFVH